MSFIKSFHSVDYVNLPYVSEIYDHIADTPIGRTIFSDRLEVLKHFIAENRWDDLSLFLDKHEIADQDKKEFFKLILSDKPEWIGLVIAKGWDRYIDSEIIGYAGGLYDLSSQHFRFICNVYNPTELDLILFLKTDFSMMRETRKFDFFSNMCARPLFLDMINGKGAAIVLLERKESIDFYKHLHGLGWKSQWFNEPGQTSATLMHLLIRQGDAKFMQRLLKEIPRNKIYLGAHFELEDFDECIPSKDSNLADLDMSGSLLVGQRHCAMIVQTEKGLVTVPGANAREFVRSHSLVKGPLSSLKIYVNPGHAHLSITEYVWEGKKSSHYGFYPLSEESASCKVDNDELNAKISDVGNYPTIEFFMNEGQKKKVESYVTRTREDCDHGKKSYTAISSNCVNFVDEAAREVGFSSGFIGRAFTPKQLIRRIRKPVFVRSQLAFKYSVARSYGVAALALTQVSAPMAIAYSRITPAEAPEILDFLIVVMLTSGLYQIIRLSCRAIHRIVSRR